MIRKMGSHAIANATNCETSTLDRNYFTIVKCIDLSKAFDTVDYDIWIIMVYVECRNIIYLIDHN